MLPTGLKHYMKDLPSSGMAQRARKVTLGPQAPRWCFLTTLCEGHKKSHEASEALATYEERVL
jgi:hypothetical protein